MARSTGEAGKRSEKVQALQHALYRSAKQDRARRFHALFDKVARSDVLLEAWRDVRSNAGAPGVDGVRIVDVEDQGVGEFLEDLSAELREGRYRPLPLRRVEIPKPGRPGEMRPLSIPCVRDRVVMAAARIVLEPIFEADFREPSYGFRPNRNAHEANETIRQTANRGFDWVIDADVKDCFSSIDHDALMCQVERRVFDRKMLKLIRAWLRTGVLSGGIVVDTVSGTPQGSPISPLLANVALHVVDVAFEEAGEAAGVLVRYADDMVVLCGSRERVEAAQVRLSEVLATVGLRLHPDKTRLVCLTGGQEGFDFLGFHHHKRRSRKRPGRLYLQQWPSARATKAARAKIRSLTDKRLVGLDLYEDVIPRLNRFLRGWGQYFRHGNSTKTLTDLDSYVHERLAIYMSRKHGRRGRGWRERYTYAWYKALPVVSLRGMVRYPTVSA